MWPFWFWLYAFCHFSWSLSCVAFPYLPLFLWNSLIWMKYQTVEDVESSSDLRHICDLGLCEIDLTNVTSQITCTTLESSPSQQTVCEPALHLTTMFFKSVVTSDSVCPYAFILGLTCLIIDTLWVPQEQQGAPGAHCAQRHRKRAEYLFDSGLAALFHAVYFQLYPWAPLAPGSPISVSFLPLCLPLSCTVFLSLSHPMYPIPSPFSLSVLLSFY